MPVIQHTSDIETGAYFDLDGPAVANLQRVGVSSGYEFEYYENAGLLVGRYQLLSENIPLGQDPDILNAAYDGSIDKTDYLSYASHYFDQLPRITRIKNFHLEENDNQYIDKQIIGPTDTDNKQESVLFVKLRHRANGTIEINRQFQTDSPVSTGSPDMMPADAEDVTTYYFGEFHHITNTLKSLVRTNLSYQILEVGGSPEDNVNFYKTHLQYPDFTRKTMGFVEPPKVTEGLTGQFLEYYFQWTSVPPSNRPPTLDRSGYPSPQSPITATDYLEWKTIKETCSGSLRIYNGSVPHTYFETTDINDSHYICQTKLVVNQTALQAYFTANLTPPSTGFKEYVLILYPPSYYYYPAKNPSSYIEPIPNFLNRTLTSFTFEAPKNYKSDGDIGYQILFYSSKGTPALFSSSSNEDYDDYEVAYWDFSETTLGNAVSIPGSTLPEFDNHFYATAGTPSLTTRLVRYRLSEAAKAALTGRTEILVRIRQLDGTMIIVDESGGGPEPSVGGRLYVKGTQNNGELALPEVFNGINVDWVSIGIFSDWVEVYTLVDSEIMVARRANGTIWSCGKKDNNEFAPKRLGYTNGNADAGLSQYELKQIGSDSDWVKLFCDCSFAVFALKANGDLYWWGQIYFGDTEVDTTVPTLFASDMQNLIEVEGDSFNFLLFILKTAGGVYSYKGIGDLSSINNWFETDSNILSGDSTIYPVLTDITPFTPFIIAGYTNFESYGPSVFDTDGNLYCDPDQTGRDFTIRDTNVAYMTQSYDLQGVLKTDGSFWLLEPYGPPFTGMIDAGPYSRIRTVAQYGTETMLMNTDGDLFYLNSNTVNYNPIGADPGAIVALPGPIGVTIKTFEYVNPQNSNRRFAVIGTGPAIPADGPPSLITNLGRQLVRTQRSASEGKVVYLNVNGSSGTFISALTTYNEDPDTSTLEGLGYSLDSGATWQLANIPGYAGTPITQLRTTTFGTTGGPIGTNRANNTAAILWVNGISFYTTDGINWTFATLPGSGNVIFFSDLISNNLTGANEVWIGVGSFTDGDGYYRSTDGQTWTRFNLPGTSHATCVLYEPASNSWYIQQIASAGVASTFLKSTDNGLTFTSLDLGSTYTTDTSAAIANLSIYGAETEKLTTMFLGPNETDLYVSFPNGASVYDTSGSLFDGDILIDGFTLIKSTNSGTTWSTIGTSNFRAQGTINGNFYTNASVVRTNYTFGSWKVLGLSEDGLDWKFYPLSNYAEEFSTVYYVCGDDANAPGDHEHIVVNTDNGLYTASKTITNRYGTGLGSGQQPEPITLDDVPINFTVTDSSPRGASGNPGRFFLVTVPAIPDNLTTHTIRFRAGKNIAGANPTSDTVFNVFAGSTYDGTANRVSYNDDSGGTAVINSESQLPLLPGNYVFNVYPYYAYNNGSPFLGDLYGSVFDLGAASNPYKIVKVFSGGSFFETFDSGTGVPECNAFQIGNYWLNFDGDGSISLEGSTYTTLQGVMDAAAAFVQIGQTAIDTTSNPLWTATAVVDEVALAIINWVSIADNLTEQFGSPANNLEEAYANFGYTIDQIWGLLENQYAAGQTACPADYPIPFSADYDRAVIDIAAVTGMSNIFFVPSLKLADNTFNSQTEGYASQAPDINGPIGYFRSPVIQVTRAK